MTAVAGVLVTENYIRVIPMPLRKTVEIFGENLKRLLSARNIKPEEAAKKIGVSKQTIYSWCAGEAWPSHKFIDKIVDLLQIPAAELLIDTWESEHHMMRYKKAFGLIDLRERLQKHSDALESILHTLQHIGDDDILEENPHDREHFTDDNEDA